MPPVRGGLLLGVVALLLAPPASAGVFGDAARARSGLNAAVASGKVAAIDARVYQRYAAEAAAAAAELPVARGANLAGALATVAAQAGQYDQPRAVALFEMLRFNTLYLRRHGLPRRGATVHDADGVAYRSVPGLGLQYHPLASFARLNVYAGAKRHRASVRLGFALMARARPTGSALVWETFYRTSGGYPPWTSGMTQAVAAQALARAGFLPFARAAYRAIPNTLLLSLPQGPWVRLYHFNRDLVLNAQLQTAISVGDYGRITRDRGAVRLAAALRQSAAALLPRFDTGDWSLYALGGGEAEVTYHGYVASLLWKLEHRTGDRFWGRWALRFRRYWRAPPEIRRGPPAAPAFPLPRDGFRDTAPIRFWISKPATIVLRIAGETRRRQLPAGAHVLTWSPKRRPPGVYDVRLSAVDRVGNRSDLRLAPVRVQRDRKPPRLAAVRISPRRVTWRATDPQSPWLDLRLVLKRGEASRRLPLGRRRHAGSAALALPRESWHATFVAVDSAGNETSHVVGILNPRPRHAE